MLAILATTPLDFPFPEKVPRFFGYLFESVQGLTLANFLAKVLILCPVIIINYPAGHGLTERSGILTSLSRR